MPTYQSNTTGVVSSFRDLHEDSQAISFRQDFDLDADGYATDAALQNQNIFAYVNDEVHACHCNVLTIRHAHNLWAHINWNLAKLD